MAGTMTFKALAVTGILVPHRGCSRVRIAISGVSTPCRRTVSNTSFQRSRTKARTGNERRWSKAR